MVKLFERAPGIHTLVADLILVRRPDGANKARLEKDAGARGNPLMHPPRLLDSARAGMLRRPVKTRSLRNAVEAARLLSTRPN